MGGAIKYPGLVKAHLFPTFVHNDYDTLFVKRFNLFLADIYDRVTLLKGQEKKQDLRIALVQMLSAILMPAVFPKMFQDFSQIDFENLEARKAYIDRLLQHYLD